MATVPLSLFSLNLTCLDLDKLFYWGCKFLDVIVQSIYKTYLSIKDNLDIRQSREAFVLIGILLTI